MKFKYFKTNFNPKKTFANVEKISGYFVSSFCVEIRVILLFEAAEFMYVNIEHQTIALALISLL